MNKYESIIIINPSLEEDGVKTLINRFSDLVNSNGKVESVEEMGKRKLAYEITHRANKETFQIPIFIEYKSKVYR